MALALRYDSYNKTGTRGQRAEQNDCSGLELSSVLLRIEQNCNVVCGEWAGVRRGAGPYDCLMIFATAQAGLQLGGKFRKVVGCVAHDEPWFASARVTSWHAARAASIFNCARIVRNLKTRLGEKASNSVLLLVKAETIHGIGEILDSVELVVADDDGYTHNLYVRVEQVGTVSLGVHPEIVDHCGFRGFSDVLGDEAEVRAGIRSTGGELGLARKLMGYTFMSGHLSRVVKRSLSENRIKPKWLKSACDPILISCGKEILLSYVRSGGRRRGCEDRRPERCCSKENNRFVGVPANPGTKSAV